MKPLRKFNAMTRETAENMKVPRSKIKLNGFDVSLQPFDGLVHYGYTGKGWIMWRDGAILGDGWADTNTSWFEMVARWLNDGLDAVGASPFVDLGFGAPKPNSKEFKRWLAYESRENGNNAAELRLDRLEVMVELKEILI